MSYNLFVCLSVTVLAGTPGTWQTCHWNFGPGKSCPRTKISTENFSPLDQMSRNNWSYPEILVPSPLSSLGTKIPLRSLVPPGPKFRLNAKHYFCTRIQANMHSVLISRYLLPRAQTYTQPNWQLGVWGFNTMHPIAPVWAQRISISLWDFIWSFNTRHYTLVHVFCFFKLFSVRCIGLTEVKFHIIRYTCIEY